MNKTTITRFISVTLAVFVLCASAFITSSSYAASSTVTQAIKDAKDGCNTNTFHNARSPLPMLDSVDKPAWNTGVLYSSKATVDGRKMICAINLVQAGHSVTAFVEIGYKKDGSKKITWPGTKKTKDKGFYYKYAGGVYMFLPKGSCGYVRGYINEDGILYQRTATQMKVCN